MSGKSFGGTLTTQQKPKPRRLAQTGQMPDGQRRLSVIGMVFFRKTHTLHGAALEASCSYATAKRWQQAFIREVACNFKCNSLIES